MENFWEIVEIDNPGIDTELEKKSVSDIYEIYSRKIITKIVYLRNKLLSEGKEYNTIVVPYGLLSIIDSDNRIMKSHLINGETKSIIGSICGIEAYFDTSLEKDVMYFTNPISKIRDQKIDIILNGSVTQSERLMVKVIIHSKQIIW
jgi:hypothetical protein